MMMPARSKSPVFSSPVTSLARRLAAHWCTPYESAWATLVRMIVAFEPELRACLCRGESFGAVYDRDNGRCVGSWLPGKHKPALFVMDVFQRRCVDVGALPLDPVDIFQSATAWAAIRRRVFSPTLAYQPSTRLRGMVCSNRGCMADGCAVCPGCKLARYCGQRCQAMDWKHGHGDECIAMATTRYIIATE